MRLLNLFRKKKEIVFIDEEEGALPAYPNHDVPDIPRDLPDFEYLLNTHGFYSEKSGIREVGVYNEDYLDIEMDGREILYLTFTFEP